MLLMLEILNVIIVDSTGGGPVFCLIAFYSQKMGLSFFSSLDDRMTNSNSERQRGS